VTVSYTEFDLRIGSVGGEGLFMGVGAVEVGYAEGGWEGALSLSVRGMLGWGFRKVRGFVPEER
jgi:hypothetical protein